MISPNPLTSIVPSPAVSITKNPPVPPKIARPTDCFFILYVTELSHARKAPSLIHHFDSPTFSSLICPIDPGAIATNALSAVPFAVVIKNPSPLTTDLAAAFRSPPIPPEPLLFIFPSRVTFPL